MKILDCTLRDGGYYTNWDFNDKLVHTYLTAFNQLPVDYLEVGYRSKHMKGYYGEYFYCPVHVLQKLKDTSNKKLVIILNEKDVNIEDTPFLLSPIHGLVDMVRIAVAPEKVMRGIKLAEAVKAMGFEVSLNVMYMSKWKENSDFLKNIKHSNGIADYFYMVDSYGSVYPKDVEETTALLKSEISGKIGFHGHNNLELALINTLTAKNCGVDIVDATIAGMGRGAGNLKTELLLTALNAQETLEVEFNALSKAVDAFSALQDEHKWGTNLPYMVSGANSLPQKDVMQWVTLRYYSFNSIIRALSNQAKGIKDNKHLERLDFSKEKSYEKAVIVGGGPSVIEHNIAIKQYLNDNASNVVIHASSKNAMNFRDITNEQFFCLVGNEGHRLEETFGKLNQIEGKCILPPFPRKMGTYIPVELENCAYELPEVSFTNLFQDSHTALALQTCLELGVKHIFIVGYDGYSGNTMGEMEQNLYYENEYLFGQVMSSGLGSIVSLTPTRYTKLQTDSVYAYIK